MFAVTGLDSNHHLQPLVLALFHDTENKKRWIEVFRFLVDTLPGCDSDRGRLVVDAQKGLDAAIRAIFKYLKMFMCSRHFDKMLMQKGHSPQEGAPLLVPLGADCANKRARQLLPRETACRSAPGGPRTKRPTIGRGVHVACGLHDGALQREPGRVAEQDAAQRAFASAALQRSFV
mmetsp:Transcript_23766/g.61202  ORF Transcript_23766/g.61202 Transcript_23766/m.61202 type:complete len:176 (+) Transcript_23766:1244-1771(+)